MIREFYEWNVRIANINSEMNVSIPLAPHTYQMKAINYMLVYNNIWLLFHQAHHTNSRLPHWNNRPNSHIWVLSTFFDLSLLTISNDYRREKVSQRKPKFNCDWYFCAAMTQSVNYFLIKQMLYYLLLINKINGLDFSFKQN